MQRRISWKVLGLFAATGIVATGLAGSKPAMSADHRDSPATVADPASDINDVYSWMDGNNFVLAMTVFPFADTSSKFSDATQYVFHTTSGTKFGETVAAMDIICTFDAAQKASCWVGADDYVTGDASGEAGITSKKGKTTVFAGRRGDPFFFNLSGFNDTVTTIDGALADLAPSENAAGCPVVDGVTSSTLAGKLKEMGSTANPSRTETDDFKTAQGLAIVVKIDKSLVTTGGPIVSVWGSTNK